jgi:cation:H+ antiporter
MLLPIIAVFAGLALLAWSADRFVDGAVSAARHLGMPPLLIGMVIVGLGTSAPEMVVSALASLEGSPGIALGNAYGSNIANIAMIIGITALILPISIHSQILKKELPILTAVTALTVWQLWDKQVTRLEGFILLGVFVVVMGWTIRQGMRTRGDALEGELEQSLGVDLLPVSKTIFWLVAGLLMLVGSSRLLVWGAVEIAQALGVSDLIIGLTIVAIGTSLPELASSITAIRKGVHDIALGNVVGSNLFNTLAVVGIAGTIHPVEVGPDVLSRDMVVMCGLTLSLFVFGYGWRGKARINRVEGGILLGSYVAYMGYLVYEELLGAV